MGDYTELVKRVVKALDDNSHNKSTTEENWSDFSQPKIASFIDHTVLKPDAAEEDILKLCAEADRYGFASAVAQPCWIETIRNNLGNPKVKICGIAGFPLGGHKTIVKALETEKCVEDGAHEVDMVMNIGWAKQGSWDLVEDDISQVVKAAGASTVVKVIIECCLLTDEEKIKASLCTVNAGAHFVKSSTGFSKGGAKTSDIELMRKVVGAEFGVKASGGIRDLSFVIELIKAGANRIGASGSVQIMEEFLPNTGQH